MTEAWYEIAAMSMRYVFLLLALAVLLKALRWMLRDARLRRQTMRRLPDAGYIGAFYVMSGESRRLDAGDEIRLPCEGTLGSARACDVCVPHPSVPARAAIFWLERDGLHMVPADPEGFCVDGASVGAGEEAVLLHGATVTAGEVMLQLRLFSGVELLGALDADGEPYVTPEARRRASRRRRPGRKGRAGRHKEESSEAPARQGVSRSPEGELPPGTSRRRRTDDAPEEGPGDGEERRPARPGRSGKKK